jgi:tRNA(Arg) A34 adenosine deaminase TadA
MRQNNQNVMYKRTHFESAIIVPASPKIETNNIIQPSQKQYRYIELAMRAAHHSEFNFKHGAVLVKSGTVVNCSFNETVYSSFATRFQRKQKWIGTRHAEVNVVLGIGRALTNGADLYVVRINSHGGMSLSAPCPMCRDLMQFVGIRRVFYSIDDENIGMIRL